MIAGELKHRTIYILGAVSVAILFLAFQVKTALEIDLGEPGDELVLVEIPFGGSCLYYTSTPEDVQRKQLPSKEQADRLRDRIC